MKDLGCRRAAGRVIKASKRVADSARHAAGLAAKSAREKAATLSNVSQGALASALSVDLNSAMVSLAKGPATIYDKAMDAKYLATSIGGGNHRLFGGGHTLSGALQAASGASSDDSIAEVAFGYMQGLFRDVTTPKGLFSCLAGGTGVAAALSANALLLIVTVVCLAKAFSEARSEGGLRDVADGLARGTATAVTTLGAVAPPRHMSTRCDALSRLPSCNALRLLAAWCRLSSASVVISCSRLTTAHSAHRRSSNGMR